MVLPDKFGRTWKNRDIVWLRSANCNRPALYRWVGRGTDRKLIYDKLNGFCDKNGKDVRETLINIVPALKGNEENTWEHFPDTDEAINFKNTLTYDGYLNQENPDIDFDEEFDEDIVIIK